MTQKCWARQIRYSAFFSLLIFRDVNSHHSHNRPTLFPLPSLPLTSTYFPPLQTAYNHPYRTNRPRESIDMPPVKPVTDEELLGEVAVELGSSLKHHDVTQSKIKVDNSDGANVSIYIEAKFTPVNEADIVQDMTMDEEVSNVVPTAPRRLHAVSGLLGGPFRPSHP